MRRDLITSALAIVVFTVLFGLVYPLATTGVSQVVFPNKADGSQVERDGKVVGARRLIGPGVLREGQATRATSSRARRPPATTRPARSSTTSGPNQKELRDLFRENLAAYLERERPVEPGLEARRRARGRRHHLGLGRRPAHLGGERAHPGAAGGRGARGSPLARVNDWSTTTRTGAARLPRRARRERARAEPGARPGEPHDHARHCGPCGPRSSRASRSSTPATRSATR